jgi:hypothetical protein
MTGIDAVDAVGDINQTIVVGADVPEQGKADELRGALKGFLEALFEPHIYNGNSVPLQPWEKEHKLEAYVQWVDEKEKHDFAVDPSDLSPGITTMVHGKSVYRISHNIIGMAGEGKEEKEALGNLRKAQEKHLVVLKNFFSKVPDPYTELAGMVKTIIDSRYAQFERMSTEDVPV